MRDVTLVGTRYDGVGEPVRGVKMRCKSGRRREGVECDMVLRSTWRYCVKYGLHMKPCFQHGHKVGQSLVPHNHGRLNRNIRSYQY